MQNEYREKKNDDEVGGVLPYPYRQVEYIESTGTQYIDTPVQNSAGYKIKTEFNLDDIQSPQFTTGVNSTTGETFIQISNPEITVWNGHTKFTGQLVSFNDFNSLEASLYRDKTKLVINNQTLYEQDGDFTNRLTIPVYLLAINNYTAQRYSKCKLKQVEYYDSNNELIFNLIPCYDTTDPTKHTAGLYDIVNNQFYGNSGTGYFIVGPDV